MRRVLLNSLSGGVRLLASAVTAFLLTPVIVGWLGNLAYGAWEILLSIQAYLVLLDLGVNPAVVRFVARNLAQGARQKLQTVFGTALLAAVVAGTIGLIVILVFALRPERLLNLEVGSVPGLRFAFVVIGIQILITFSGAVFVATLMGLQRHYMVNAVKTLAVIVQATLIYLALTRASGPGLAWLASIYTAVAIIENLILASVLLWARNSSRVIVRPAISWSVAKELYAFGFKSLTLMAAQRLQKQLMPIVIGWVLGVGQVVFFVLPSRLIDYAHDLSMSLGFPLTARFAELDGKGDMGETRDAWFKYTRFLQLILIPLGVGILVLGESFLNIWIGDEYGTGGRWVVRFLATAFLVEALAPNAGRLLVAFDQHGRAAAWSLAIAILTVPVVILMASRYGLGGVAGSILISRSLQAAVTWHLAGNALCISLASHLRGTALRFLIPAALQALCLKVLLEGSPPVGYGALAATAGLSLIPYALTGWFLALTADERRVIRGWKPLKSRVS